MKICGIVRKSDREITHFENNEKAEKKNCGEKKGAKPTKKRIDEPAEAAPAAAVSVAVGEAAVSYNPRD